VDGDRLSREIGKRIISRLRGLRGSCARWLDESILAECLAEALQELSLVRLDATPEALAPACDRLEQLDQGLGRWAGVGREELERVESPVEGCRRGIRAPELAHVSDEPPIRRGVARSEGEHGFEEVVQDDQIGEAPVSAEKEYVQKRPVDLSELGVWPV